MNFLKKGPELKLPQELKVPDFLLDVYYDLRERHLLPLVVVLAVGIVAVPIALGGSSGSEEPETSSPVAGASVAAGGSGELVVAKAAPGLRDYRKRLAAHSATDPFRQQYANEGGGSPGDAQAATVIPGGEGSAALGIPEPSGSSNGAPLDPSSGGGATKIETQAKYASDAIDVRIVPVDSGDDAESSQAKPSVRRKVPELTMLPSRETPVVIFMGASSDGKKALLLVSSDVQSVFGDGSCVVGSQVCQLLALEKGLPETFVYGPQGHTFRIEVLKIDRTLGDKPRRASLGSPKAGSRAGKEDQAQTPGQRRALP